MKDLAGPIVLAAMLPLLPLALTGAAVLLYLLVNALVSVPYLAWIKRLRPDAESQARA